HPRGLVLALVEVVAVERDAMLGLALHRAFVLVHQEAATQDQPQAAADGCLVGELVRLEPGAGGALPLARHGGKAGVRAIGQGCLELLVGHGGLRPAGGCPQYGSLRPALDAGSWTMGTRSRRGR